MLAYHRYVATLESRIKNLERQLQIGQFNQARPTTGHCLTPDTTTSEPQVLEDATAVMHQNRPITQHGPGSLTTTDERQVSQPDLTILEMVYGRAYLPEAAIEPLSKLPSLDGARKLVDAAYFYTQARYCIIDWAQLGVWHQQRDELTCVSSRDSVKSQTGRYQLEFLS
jgi:hypothetical protein